MKTKILSLVMLVVWISLAIYLVFAIKNTINEKERIAKMEDRIIEQLVMIREASNAYLAVNGKYTNDWDTLGSFLDTGSFYLTQRKEKITTLAYGKEEVEVTVDTLGKVKVLDSILTKKQHPRFVLEELAYVPGVEPRTKFDLWAGKTNKAGIDVNVIEVRNPKPINPARSLENPYEKDRPLGFGSRENVTTAGNWE